MNRKHLNFAALSASTEHIHDLRFTIYGPSLVCRLLLYSRSTIHGFSLLCVIGVICGQYLPKNNNELTSPNRVLIDRKDDL